MKKAKNIIAYTTTIPKGVVESIRAYEKVSGNKYRIMLIENSARGLPADRTGADFPGVDIILKVNFSDPFMIQQALLPYEKELLAVSCRAESFIADFSALIPHVPYLETPTDDSIAWASDKLTMRRRFKQYDSSITPKYTRVKDQSAEERERLIKKIGLPMIVKPTNLAQSLLVQVVHHEDELKKALKDIFAAIERIYKENGRIETPRIIAEEFMEGLMYSVDAYVNAQGKVWFCPLVRVKTGKDIGRDDFYGYLQMTPTKLSKDSILRAEDVAEKGIHALGLRSTTAHVELMRVDNDWKIIEIGARVGGFRHILHEITCGINHSMNDVLIRMGKKPIVTKRCAKFAAAMKWYAPKEGVITTMTGLKKIESLESFDHIDVLKKRGDAATFAKNGGKAIFHLFLAHESRSQLLADIRRVEEMVKIEVA